MSRDRYHFFSRAGETDRSPDGDARFQDLLRYIREDRERNDGAPTAHIKWRDEVIGRVSGNRPLFLRIPLCIAQHLLNLNMCGVELLETQEVIMVEGGAVYERPREMQCSKTVDVTKLRMIVPPQT